MLKLKEVLDRIHSKRQEENEGPKYEFQNAPRVLGRIRKCASLAPLRSLFGLFGIQQKNRTEMQLEGGGRGRYVQGSAVIVKIGYSDNRLQ